MGIVAVLAALLLPIMAAAKKSARIKQARKEISDICGAITNYYVDRDRYPPDTADWGQGEDPDNIDSRSLYCHLGRAFEDSKGKSFGSYLAIKFERRTDVEEDGAGVYTDPWGMPYHMDAVHTVIVNDVPTRVGAPYASDTKVPSDQRTLDFKVVSYGPDMEVGFYPFDPSGAVELKKAKDDIGSW